MELAAIIIAVIALLISGGNLLVLGLSLRSINKRNRINLQLISVQKKTQILNDVSESITQLEKLIKLVEKIHPETDERKELKQRIVEDSKKALSMGREVYDIDKKIDKDADPLALEATVQVARETLTILKNLNEECNKFLKEDKKTHEKCKEK